MAELEDITDDVARVPRSPGAPAWSPRLARLAGAVDRHARRVAAYAETSARRLGLDDDRVETIAVAGALHDVGKLRLRPAILEKAGPLTDEEWCEVRRHPELGARLLTRTRFAHVSPIVVAHHERVDGTGYPYGLRGSDIPLEARIIAVADAYEAMTSDRVYRTSLGHEEARDELERGAGAQFDSEVVETFVDSVIPPRRSARPRACGASAGRAARP